MKASLLTGHWPKETPLWQVFWIYGVAFSWLLTGALFAPLLIGKLTLSYYLMTVLIMGGYTGWILLAIWRCADHVQNPIWGAAARMLTAAWAINMALLLFFVGFNVVQLPT